ncbi:MAG: endonuclease/exonuclease/phosphatase family protein [Verrucomicrobiota bacterium]
MDFSPRWFSRCVGVFVVALAAQLRAETFRVATYNVENYLDQPTESRPRAKSPEAKAKVREQILALRPDVIALEEMGTTNALLELRAALKAGGLDLPHWEFVNGHDTNIHVVVLSRFPFIARRPHTNDQFLLEGRRLRVSRGFAEVDVQVNPRCTFTLIAAHLKSRRVVSVADEAAMRLEEAKMLRNIVDARLTNNPAARLIVLGDFNDYPDARSTKTILGRGRNRLIDTRPVERHDDCPKVDSNIAESRTVAWTHHYGVEDLFSRIDYILISPALKRSWVTDETYVLARPGWGIASDHRPLVATFDTERDPDLALKPK